MGAVPAVEVDTDKNGFHEEEDALIGKEGAHNRSSIVDVGRPEQAEFKRDHGAGDSPDDKEQQHGFGPAARQQHPIGVFVPQSQSLRDTQQERYP